MLESLKERERERERERGRFARGRLSSKKKILSNYVKAWCKSTHALLMHVPYWAIVHFT